ncbi:MAG: TIGR04282 family arsenosugar biosynthesis glycosyltransferase [Gemmatimonadaceae bacterium]
MSRVDRNRLLIIFARAPELGRVKTRMAAELGDAAALAIYRFMAGQVIDCARSAAGYHTIVAYDPPDAGPTMRAWLGPSLTLRPQCDGDLGTRMSSAIGDGIAGGAHAVVVIGTDCPEISAPDIQNAFERLDHADLVIGPARDGGYYLIGMSRLHTCVFDGVPWSDPDTLRVTLARAAAASLSVALLDLRRDIDTAADWHAWRSRQTGIRRWPPSADTPGR